VRGSAGHLPPSTLRRPADLVDTTPTANYYCNPGYYGTSGVLCSCT